MTEQQSESPKLDATASIRFPEALADAAKRAAARDGYASAGEWIRAMVVQEIRRRDAAVPVAAAVDRTERDLIHADLGQLLEVLGLGDYARPESPHEVMQQCIARVAQLRDGARMLGKIVTGDRRAMEAARIEMRQNGPHAAMQWILNSLPDVWDDPETEWDGTESANEWFDRTDSFYRAAEAAPEPSGEAGAGDDTGRAFTAADAQPREHPGTVLAIDPADFRELIGSALDGSIDLCARCKVCHEQVDTVMAVAWPLLEHAQLAAAGSHEGIRLWMLDCGELVAKHRERAEAAESALARESLFAAGQADRAEAAEGKLAAITEACRSIPSPIADRILAITGTEGDERHG